MSLMCPFAFFCNSLSISMFSGSHGGVFYLSDFHIFTQKMLYNDILWHVRFPEGFCDLERLKMCVISLNSHSQSDCPFNPQHTSFIFIKNINAQMYNGVNKSWQRKSTGPAVITKQLNKKVAWGNGTINIASMYQFIQVPMSFTSIQARFTVIFVDSCGHSSSERVLPSLGSWWIQSLSWETWCQERIHCRSDVTLSQGTK